MISELVAPLPQCAPTSTHRLAPVGGAAITGADLAAEIDALMRRVPGLSKRRIGYLVYGKHSGVEDLRRKGKARPRTIERIRAFIANPPPEAFTPPRRPARPPKPRLTREQRAARISEGIKRSNRLKAQERIRQGLKIGGGGQAVKLTQMALERMMADQARGQDPIEQAKTLLRRTGRVVYSMSVYGGPKDKFIISGRGKEPIDTTELLRLAEKLAA